MYIIYSMSIEYDNARIKHIIEDISPFFIGRIAGIELQIAYSVLKRRPLDMLQEIQSLENNAGIHIKNIDSLHNYVNKLVESYEHCSAIAEWDIKGDVFSKTGDGQLLIAERTPTILKLNALSLEPYYVRDSWMPALEGKKILIIHPFANTIKHQIENVHKLFPERHWFQNCTFTHLSPPQTLAGNHQNIDWQHHLNTFLDTLHAHTDFDVALVAAGGYGMLIADEIFMMKKSVMYIGGALQLFFGIIGKRWFDNKEIMALVNDDWVRPFPTDKPSNCVKVEKGCYW
jgi:hypothetical protein